MWFVFQYFRIKVQNFILNKKSLCIDCFKWKNLSLLIFSGVPIQMTTQWSCCKTASRHPAVSPSGCSSSLQTPLSFTCTVLFTFAFCQAIAAQWWDTNVNISREMSPLMLRAAKIHFGCSLLETLCTPLCFMFVQWYLTGIHTAGFCSFLYQDCDSGHHRREGRSLDFHDSSSISMGPLMLSEGNTGEHFIYFNHFVNKGFWWFVSLIHFTAFHYIPCSQISGSQTKWRYLRLLVCVVPWWCYLFLWWVSWHTFSFVPQKKCTFYMYIVWCHFNECGPDDILVLGFK